VINPYLGDCRGVLTSKGIRFGIRRGLAVKCIEAIFLFSLGKVYFKNVRFGQLIGAVLGSGFLGIKNSVEY